MATSKIGPGKFPGLFQNITNIMLKGLPQVGPGNDVEFQVRRRWDEIRRHFLKMGYNTDPAVVFDSASWPKNPDGTYEVRPE